MDMPQRIGKYEVMSQIAVGGFGVIYKAWDPFIKRQVAIKMCSSPDEEVRQRFYQEAQFVGNLVHRNITMVFDFGLQDDVPYLVQEFLTGFDLDELVNSGVLGDLTAVTSVMLQVAEGLRFAHQHGIVHRDIKPSNIRILEDGTVKIMDFGIAKSVEGGSKLTQTGIALGTAGYLAPEQIQGDPVDQRTDIFSLGVVAYELVTGSRPFRGTSLSNILYRILNEVPEKPRVFSPKCPAELEEIISKCLEKNPDDRYQTVDDLIEDLRRVPLGPETAFDGIEFTTGILRRALNRLPDRPVQGEEPNTTPMKGTRVLGRDGEEQSHRIHHEPEIQTDAARRGNPVLVVFVILLGLVIGAGALIYFSPATQQLVFGPEGPPWIPTPTPTPTPTPLPSPTPTPTPEVPPTPTPEPTPTQGPVVVRLVVDPPSPVKVDGRWQGDSDTAKQVHSVRVMPGSRVFTVLVDGLEPQKLARTVTSVDGQTIGLTVEVGFLTVQPLPGSAPPGGRVFLDGRVIGTIPLIRKKVLAGTHQLVVHWDGHAPFERRIDVPSLPSPGLNVGDAAPPD